MSAHGLQDANNCDEAVKQSVVPESIIYEQDGFDALRERATARRLPFWAKEHGGVTENCGDLKKKKSLYIWFLM